MVVIFSADQNGAIIGKNIQKKSVSKKKKIGIILPQVLKGVWYQKKSVFLPVIFRQERLFYSGMIPDTHLRRNGPFFLIYQSNREVLATDLSVCPGRHVIIPRNQIIISRCPHCFIFEFH